MLGVLGFVVAASIGLYVTLLFTPIPLPFVREQARSLVTAALPPSSSIEMGDVALALEGAAWPVLQFSPVEYTDARSGATVRMAALEMGFSPIRALFGQPGATITVVAPRLQVNQDLFGPRLATLDVVADSSGGPPTVRVLEGADAFPSIGIRPEGVAVSGQPEGQAPMMRSDNDWLIYNLQAAAESINAVVEQARLGRFSRLVVRDGELQMNDALYGLFRVYDGISLDITLRPDGETAGGPFAARFGGRTMRGSLERTVDADGSVRLRADITNLDFASFMPFLDDTDSIISLEGTGALSLDMRFAPDGGRVLDGTFRVDLTGTELRVNDDFFPIVTSIVQVDWDPAKAQFTMADAEIAIGKSSARVNGIFALGLDGRFGPTVGLSLKASNVMIGPNDLPAPAAAFTSMVFEGWAAPLYGAMGIDLFRADKPGAWIETKGRADMIRRGLGFAMTIVGEGLSADDLKRLWPYFISRETRDWFVANVSDGQVERSTMKYNFPIGTIGNEGDEKALPPNSISIDMVANGVRFRPLDTMIPVAVDGKTRLWVRDGKLTVSADGAMVGTAGGDLAFANAALVMDSEKPGQRLIEISGDVSGGVPAIVALARQQQPEAMANARLPLDIDAIAGNVAMALVSTIVLDDEGRLVDLDYAINGSVLDFASTKPIETHNITDGQLSFVASQEGYRFAGQAKVNGVSADLVVEGAGAQAPSMLISSTLDINDLKSVGFDTSEFLSGAVKFVGRPMPGGSLQLAVDIADAALNLRDLGISKEVGVPGLLEAEVKQTGTLTELSRVNLSFGDVSLKGSLDYDLEDGLISADFTTFALSPGDKAELALSRIADGYQLKLRGEQLDLKPMLKRYFGLGPGSTGGPQATVVTQTIVLDARLDRALGFYRSTAYNLDVRLTLRGSDLQNVTLQTQLGGGASVSVATNPGPKGKVLSVAFNDLGALLRLIGVYGNVNGGQGSLVMQTFDEGGYDAGSFVVRDLAIVDEANLARLLEAQGSGGPVSGQNALEFRSARADFVRRRDRFEVTEVLASGDDVGVTARGFIYTEARTYDITGTYVPLFGLNNMFQKLPIVGPLIGGREGEGLFGVTFAIRGSLEGPKFQVNPVSALLPGALRRLFEFRAKEQPQAE